MHDSEEVLPSIIAPLEVTISNNFMYGSFQSIYIERRRRMLVCLDDEWPLISVCYKNSVPQHRNNINRHIRGNTKFFRNIFSTALVLIFVINITSILVSETRHVAKKLQTVLLRALPNFFYCIFHVFNNDYG